MPQWNLKSPMCRFLWISKFDLYIVAYPHMSHTWFFAPVWTFMCPVSSKFRLNDLWHMSHWKGRAVLWHTICFDKRFSFENAFPQHIHLNNPEDVWDFMWSVSFNLFLYVLLQVVHMNVLWYPLCASLSMVLAFAEVDLLLDFPTNRLEDLEKR
jgi:hypothetical protein